MWTLSDLISGVAKIENVDGFPLESLPAQGEVIVTFRSGATVTVLSDEQEFREAIEILAERA